MANRKQHEHDYADTEVLPPHLSSGRVETLDDAAAEAHGRYDEYVRFLDDVPVLDEVVSEPNSEKKRAKRVPRSARSKS